MKKRLLYAFAALLALLLLAFALRSELYRRARGLPPYTHARLDERMEMLAMKDGVKLRMGVYLPEGAGPFPAVLIRNPYAARAVFGFNCQILARYGYACVIQDTRGMNDSEGEWLPFRHERSDGLETVEWLRKQPFVNGNIALLGPSYLGAVQWLIADALPPEVKTIIPQVFGTDLYEPAYERGLFRHEVNTAWATLMPEARVMRLRSSDDYIAASKHRPAIEADELYMTRKLPWYREWLENPNPGDPLWQQSDIAAIRGTPGRLKIPVLMIGGWFDPFLNPQFTTWNTLATRAESAMLIGPYNHLGLVAAGVEGIDDAGGGLDQWPQVLDWLGHQLKGEPLRLLEKGKIRVRGIGTKGWETLSQLEGTAHRTLHLGAGDAQSCTGAPLVDAPTAINARYHYDPKDPNPSRGGASLLAFAFYRSIGIEPGPAEQGESCKRDDVLTWRMEQLASPMLLSGRTTLKLKVTSTADDTAFVARLIAEDDKGHALLIRENAATLALPFGDTQSPLTYAPGSEREIEIDFWPIRWELQKGHRLRVDLSSSSFPALAIHSNFAGPWATQKETRPADQTVLAGTLDVPLGVAQ